MELVEALSDVERRLAELIDQRDGLNDRIAQLTDEHRGLQLAVSRHGLQPKPNPADVNDWSGLTRTAAITRVLRASAIPLSPTEITQRLVSNGRRDTAHNVSAALAHLQNRDRAKSVGHGQWVHPDYVAPEATSTSPSQNGSGSLTSLEEVG